MIPDWNPITQSYEFAPDVFVIDPTTAILASIPAILWIFIVGSALLMLSPNISSFPSILILTIAIQIFIGAWALFSVWNLYVSSIVWNVVPQFDYGLAFVAFFVISAAVHISVWTLIILYFRAKGKKEVEA